jgi:hypothetical protein
MDGNTRDTRPASAESWTVPEPRPAPSTVASAPLFSPGSVLVERYELRRLVGRGGMGVVYEAHDHLIDQLIALKIVRAEYAGERAWAERLAREVKLARQINHPNVCRVYDFGVADGHPFLTMELAAGGTLREEIREGALAARSIEQRLGDLRAMAAGLAAIHGAGIIHRDVSPQNVLRMGDGRLVLSDFGLATDRFDGTSSVHGGTAAYMAPEVIRGGGASFASDLWALGIVMHEVMFGARPSWSKGGRMLLEPVHGGALDPAERAALDACRACVVDRTDRRPESAGQVLHLLNQRPGRWQLRRHRKALRAAAAGLFLAVAGTATVAVRRRAAESGHNSDGMAVAVAAGEPEDWTDTSKVLATVPDRIRCLTLLPDRKTVRFVWGSTPRAEDLDLTTGARTPSPLVSAAYAEGCPHIAPDQSKMIFAGHDSNDRPFVFLSRRLDGADATPVVQSGEPSMDSDPVWFPDSDSFLYGLDLGHAAIYSVSSRMSTVVPADTQGVFSTGYDVVDRAIVVTRSQNTMAADVERFWYPHMKQDLDLRIGGFPLNWTSNDGRHYLFTAVTSANRREILRLDSQSMRVTAGGYVSGRHLRYPLSTPLGLLFVAFKRHPALLLRAAEHQLHEVDLPSEVVAASSCGEGIVGMIWRAGQFATVMLDASGRVLRTLDVGPDARWPTCSSDGRLLYFADYSGPPRLVCCEGRRCVTVRQMVRVRLFPAT